MGYSRKKQTSERVGGGGGGGGAAGPAPPPPQIFVKYDLLPIDNYSEKKKVARNIKTPPNSSRATGNITLVFFR